MGQILSSLLEIFYTKKLDIVVIGLENRCVEGTEFRFDVHIEKDVLACVFCF